MNARSARPKPGSHLPIQSARALLAVGTIAIALVAACINIDVANNTPTLVPSPTPTLIQPTTSPDVSPTAVASSPAPTALTTAATATAEPSPPPTATPRATTSPTIAANEPNLSKGQTVLTAWTPPFSEYVYFMVIQEVINTGTGWAELRAFDSSYEIFDQSGAVLTTASFLYSYPVYIGPGETGYLIEEGVQDGADEADFASVNVDGRYRDVEGPPDQMLETSNLTLRVRSLDDSLFVTGQARNTGTRDVDRAQVAAIFFGSDREIIGASTTNLLENVGAGQTRAFETIGGNPLRRSQVVDFVAVAAASTDF